MTDGSAAGPAGAGSRAVPSPVPIVVPTVFLGSGGFATPILAALAAHPSVDVVGVVTAPPRPVGRRAVLTRTPVHERADAAGLAIQTPERLRDPVALDAILALGPELVVLADYGQIVPAALLELRHGALNLHPSLLPRHRGATPIPAAILAGDAETGVTLMRMDRGLDTGPIVAVERVPLGAGEATPELETRLAAIAAALLARSLDPWLAGELPAQPQDDSTATLTRPLGRADGRLDPSRPAAALERQVRAYRPWPGTFLDLPGGRVGVLGARVVPSQAGDAPGRIVSDAAGPALATLNGRLLLDDVQPAGGRSMSGEAWLRGRPSIVGSHVPA